MILKDKTTFSLPLNHIAERITGVCRYRLQNDFAESLDTFAQNLQDAQPTVFAVPRYGRNFKWDFSQTPTRKA